MNVRSQIESLLFVSIKPLSVKKISELLGASKEDVGAALTLLVNEYNSGDRGIRIQQNGVSYQMVTSPEQAELVSAFLKEDITGELTQPQLETLTVIAYRGPITKTELELIRGVNCSLILRNLLMRGLIQEKEDKEKMVSHYTVTFDLLQHLGITSVKDLPDYEALNSDEQLQGVLEQAEDLGEKQ